MTTAGETPWEKLRLRFVQSTRRFTDEMATWSNVGRNRNRRHPPLMCDLLLGVGRLGVYGAATPGEHGGTATDSFALRVGITGLAYGQAGRATSAMRAYLLAAPHGSPAPPVRGRRVPRSVRLPTCKGDTSCW